jgi:hypothetical protein
MSRFRRASLGGRWTNQRRSLGVLTDEEFTAAKAKILNA